MPTSTIVRSRSTSSSLLPKKPNSTWKEKDPSLVKQSVQNALKEAMRLEHVPPGQFQDLLWIMAQESSGQVGARNCKSTARGLYQLTEANYYLFPSGARSIGNAIEESQGGIRYIRKRYGNATIAKEFWLKHHWY